MSIYRVFLVERLWHQQVVQVVENVQMNGGIPVLPGQGKVWAFPSKHVHGWPEQEEGAMTVLRTQGLNDLIQLLQSET